MGKIFAEHWQDYELIDAGNHSKLERWGKIVTIRPEINAYFKPGYDLGYWKKMAHVSFVPSSSTKGHWEFHKAIPNKWQIQMDQLIINLKFTTFKHLGLFPEQKYNWDWLNRTIKPQSKFLNLFAYTGVSSLVAKSRGADVYHCDSIKSVNEWGRENMQSSGLDNIHWITEDAMKFVVREIKRGNKYHIIFMDPPAFGMSANKKRWKIENEFEGLVTNAFQLLEPNGKIVLNTYSPRLSVSTIHDFLTTLNSIRTYRVDTLCIKSRSEKRLEYGLRTLIET